MFVSLSLYFSTLVESEVMSKILIIHDHVETISVLHEFFQSQCVESITVGTAHEALELLKEQSFFAVFCALVLPRMGGLEFINEMREVHETTPIVIIAGQSDTDGILASLDSGAFAFLTKPLTLASVHAMYHRLLQADENLCCDDYCLENIVSESQTLEIGNNFESVFGIISFITQHLPFYNLTTKDEYITMKLMLAKALENAIFYGNLELSQDLKQQDFYQFLQEAEKRRQMEDYKYRRVHISYELNTNSAKYIFRDEGKGFDHREVPDPKTAEGIFQANYSGLVSIRHFMDEVFWNERGNQMTIIRYKKKRS